MNQPTEQIQTLAVRVVSETTAMRSIAKKKKNTILNKRCTSEAGLILYYPQGNKKNTGVAAFTVSDN